MLDLHYQLLHNLNIWIHTQHCSRELDACGKGGLSLVVDRHAPCEVLDPVVVPFFQSWSSAFHHRLNIRSVSQRCTIHRRFSRSTMSNHQEHSSHRLDRIHRRSLRFSRTNCTSHRKPWTVSPRQKQLISTVGKKNARKYLEANSFTQFSPIEPR